MKRMLAGLLAAAMIFTSIPVDVFAAASEFATDYSNVENISATQETGDEFYDGTKMTDVSGDDEAMSEAPETDVLESIEADEPDDVSGNELLPELQEELPALMLGADSDYYIVTITPKGEEPDVRNCGTIMDALQWISDYHYTKAVDITVEFTGAGSSEGIHDITVNESIETVTFKCASAYMVGKVFLDGDNTTLKFVCLDSEEPEAEYLATRTVYVEDYKASNFEVENCQELTFVAYTQAQAAQHDKKTGRFPYEGSQNIALCEGCKLDFDVCHDYELIDNTVDLNPEKLCFGIEKLTMPYGSYIYFQKFPWRDNIAGLLMKTPYVTVDSLNAYDVHGGHVGELRIDLEPTVYNEREGGYVAAWNKDEELMVLSDSGFNGNIQFLNAENLMLENALVAKENDDEYTHTIAIKDGTLNMKTVAVTVDGNASTRKEYLSYEEARLALNKAYAAKKVKHAYEFELLDTPYSTKQTVTLLPEMASKVTFTDNTQHNNNGWEFSNVSDEKVTIKLSCVDTMNADGDSSYPYVKMSDCNIGSLELENVHLYLFASKIINSLTVAKNIDLNVDYGSNEIGKLVIGEGCVPYINFHYAIYEDRSPARPFLKVGSVECAKNGRIVLYHTLIQSWLDEDYHLYDDEKIPFFEIGSTVPSNLNVRAAYDGDTDKPFGVIKEMNGSATQWVLATGLPNIEVRRNGETKAIATGDTFEEILSKMEEAGISGDSVKRFVVYVRPDTKLDSRFFGDLGAPTTIQLMPDTYTQRAFELVDGEDTIALTNNVTLKDIRLNVDNVFLQGHVLTLDNEKKEIETELVAHKILGDFNGEHSYTNSRGDLALIYDGTLVCNNYCSVTAASIGVDTLETSVTENYANITIEQLGIGACGLSVQNAILSGGQIKFPAEDENCTVNIHKLTADKSPQLCFLFDSYEPENVAAKVYIDSLEGRLGLGARYHRYGFMEVPADMQLLFTPAKPSDFYVASASYPQKYDYTVHQDEDGYIYVMREEIPEGKHRVYLNFGDQWSQSELILYLEKGEKLPNITLPTCPGRVIDALYYVPNGNWDKRVQLYDGNGKPVKQTFEYDEDIYLGFSHHSVAYTIEYVPNFPADSGGVAKQNVKWGMNYNSSDESWGFYDAPGYIYTTNAYEIVGWSTAPVDPMYDEDNEPDYMVGRDRIGNLSLEDKSVVKLYAVWAPKTFYITYMNGGVLLTGFDEDDPEPTYALAFYAEDGVPEGDLADEDDFKNIPNGYTFAGWYKTSDYKPADRVTSIPAGTTKDITLYAKWEPGSYQIMFEGNGAGNSYKPDKHDPEDPECDCEQVLTMSGISAKFGQVVKLPANVYKYYEYEEVYNERKDDYDYVKRPYVFAGWTLTPVEPNCSDLVYSAEEVEQYGGTLAFKDKEQVIDLFNSEDFDPDGDNVVVLYAAFKNVFKLEYVGENTGEYSVVRPGSVSYEDYDYDEHTYKYGKSYAMPVAVRPGYKFGGWYLDEACKKKANITKTTTGDFKLYPKWTGASYKIVYHNYDEPLIYDYAPFNKPSKKTQNMVYGTEKALTANGFKFAGYTFKGWKTQGGGEAVLSDKALFDGYSVDGCQPIWHEAGDYKPIEEWTAAEIKKVEEGGEEPIYKTAGFSDLHLYADWEAIIYHITFPNGDDEKAGVSLFLPSEYTATEIITNAGSMVVPDAHTINEYLDEYRPGYKFGGWYTDAACKKPLKTVKADDWADTKNMVISPSTIGDFSVYAKWMCDYTIVFDGNGADNEYKPDKHSDDEYCDCDPVRLMADKKAKVQTTFTLPKNTYKMAGYAFVGWSLEPDGDIIYKDAAKVLDPEGIQPEYEWDEDKEEDIVYNTLTLYAVWDDEFDITYEMNGGSFDDDTTVQTTYGIGEAVALPTPVKEGYKFGGWFTDAACKKKAAITNKSVGDVTLYAKWTGLGYKVIFNNNVPSEIYNVKAAKKNQSLVMGTSKVLTANSFKIKGYTFQGWALEPDGEVVLSNKEQFNGKKVIITGNPSEDPEGDPEEGFEGDPEEGFEDDGEEGPEPDSITIGAVYNPETGKMNDLNLYAVWTKDVYTITYYDSFGYEWTDTYSVTDGPFELDIPGRVGYTFVGWYKNEKLTQKANTTVKYGSTGNIKVYAKWKLN